MKRIELKESNVIFDEAKHTYTLNGKVLSGITGMLQRQLYPNEYADIDEEILNAAAKYGTGVHKAIEDYDIEWSICDEHKTEVNDYIGICREHGLTHESTEYTVTDRETWASNIDKVFRASEDTFHLGDIKTYGEMTPEKKDKARWQLSIYAYLFEAQNKGAKVDKLFILHIRNKKKKDGTYNRIGDYIEVTRIPADICKELLDADRDGLQFVNPYGMPEEYKQAEEHLRHLVEQKAVIEQELAEFKAKVLADMEAKEQKTWATDTMRITRKMPTSRVTFDSKRLKADHPDIDFSLYEKVSQVAGSVTITL